MWSRKYLVCSDWHVPFHDEPLIKSIINFASEQKITDIVLNGDILDMYQISKFPKIFNGVHRRLDLQYEIDVLTDLFCYIRKIFHGNIYYIKGNHSERLEKYLASKAQELNTIRSLDLCELLCLKRFDIIYVPRWLIIPSPFIIIYHGMFTGENASKRELLRHNCNLICAHTHKTSIYEAIGYFGKITCWHTGSLADKTKLDDTCKYSQYNYQTQSFAILSLNKERFKVDMVNIEANDFIYEGEVYEKIY